MKTSLNEQSGTLWQIIQGALVGRKSKRGIEENSKKNASEFTFQRRFKGLSIFLVSRVD